MVMTSRQMEQPNDMFNQTLLNLIEMNLTKHAALKTDLNKVREREIVNLEKTTEKYISSFDHKKAIKDWTLFKAIRDFNLAKQAIQDLEYCKISALEYVKSTKATQSIAHAFCLIMQSIPVQNSKMSTEVYWTHATRHFFNEGIKEMTNKMPEESIIDSAMIIQLQALVKQFEVKKLTKGGALACIAEWILSVLAFFEGQVQFKYVELEEQMCGVCQMEYEEEDELTSLKCKHHLHTDCVKEWFKMGRNTCPYCRVAVKD